MAVPQPDCESAEAEEVAALDVVDWAAARPATARMMAFVYCIVMVDVMLFGYLFRRKPFLCLNAGVMSQVLLRYDEQLNAMSDEMILTTAREK
jgi:hypothetical protein